MGAPDARTGRTPPGKNHRWPRSIPRPPGSCAAMDDGPPAPPSAPGRKGKAADWLRRRFERQNLDVETYHRYVSDNPKPPTVWPSSPTRCPDTSAAASLAPHPAPCGRWYLCSGSRLSSTPLQELQCSADNRLGSGHRV